MDSLIPAQDHAPQSNPNYPLIEPGGLAAQFTAGLVADVADLLVRHGFPAPSGADLLELQQALHDFIYGGAR